MISLMRFKILAQGTPNGSIETEMIVVQPGKREMIICPYSSD